MLNAQDRPFQVRYDNWSSADLLAGLPQPLSPPITRASWEPILWNDLCSEFDSAAMYEHIRRSALWKDGAFKEVLERWRHDEANHASGFMAVYAGLYGLSEADVQRRLEARTPDFSPIQRWLEDEMTTCILFAFDEIATFRAYTDDYAFYDRFGVPGLATWIRRVARDEGRHFGNFVSLVKARHRGRLDAAKAVVDEILAFDLRPHDYRATFVLDHTGPQFTPAFLEDCASTLKRALNLPTLN